MQVTKEVFKAAGGRLKVVGRAGVGVDNVDLASATDMPPPPYKPSFLSMQLARFWLHDLPSMLRSLLPAHRHALV